MPATDLPPPSKSSAVADHQIYNFYLRTNGGLTLIWLPTKLSKSLPSSLDCFSLFSFVDIAVVVLADVWSYSLDEALVGPVNRGSFGESPNYGGDSPYRRDVDDRHRASGDFGWAATAGTSAWRQQKRRLGLGPRVSYPRVCIWKHQDRWIREPGEMEEDFAQMDTAKLFQITLGSRDPRPPCIPKEIGFIWMPVSPLPSCLLQDDINYFASKFNHKGFTGPLNYYRALNLYVYIVQPLIVELFYFFFLSFESVVEGSDDTPIFSCCRNWELMAPWSGVQIRVAVKFIVSHLDITYNLPA
ncbi:60S ribosomal protein L18 [Hibiscus syriacus]|uniref:60S ribosomal protein L18 n=1 Tax=Hibiscus syriacus TaxID=106335 RepID=A0A6A3ABN2_HIBSY|nr:60S ribosomal protein L18 [Hibiscus syriacus]